MLAQELPWSSQRVISEGQLLGAVGAWDERAAGGPKPSPEQQAGEDLVVQLCCREWGMAACGLSEQQAGAPAALQPQGRKVSSSGSQKSWAGDGHPH